MSRASSAEFRKIKEQRMANIGRCELCGGYLGLELHHIIPHTYGGDDSGDNLILICRGCHAKLTPKSLLTKNGQKKLTQGAGCVYAYDFYEKLDKIAQSEERLSAVDVIEIFDELIVERVVEDKQDGLVKR